jgi:phosphoglucan,water dikinase
VNPHIRIGNQSAYSAFTPLEPLEFALEHGFDVFEWFADKKVNEDGTAHGWDESDMDADQRASIKRLGKEKDILFTVHAPWQANPLWPEAKDLLRRSVDFAHDIGADLVNLHLYMDHGPAAYAKALTSTLNYASHKGVRISIENTPLTSPADFADTFAHLNREMLANGRVGMCFDIGHANLYGGTRNDYIRYLDELSLEVPIIHLHVHENWGDEDAHLTLFTGPARDNEAGVRALLERMMGRGYAGAMILEQWPEPSALLVEATKRLRKLIDRVQPPHRPYERLTEPDEEPSAKQVSAPVQPLDKFSAAVITANEEYRSWRRRLEWVRDQLSAPGFEARPQQLATLAIYLRFLGTGEVTCEEDGGHYRPNHHARAAEAIETTLARMSTAQTEWILRKIYPWLPAYSAEFQRGEPLTRIRDIAHRNDIPKELKREIKQRLQNKLHRSAGPEDLKTSAEILARVTAPGAAYSEDFVAQFKLFHQELSEFFNAAGLEVRLKALAPHLAPEVSRRLRDFLVLKAQNERSDNELLILLKHLTELREALAGQRIEAEGGAQSQQRRLADIGLEEYAFVLLSEYANRLAVFKVEDSWKGLFKALHLALTNVRLGLIEPEECEVLVSELATWSHPFDNAHRLNRLRLKATLERIRRIGERYSAQVESLFTPRVENLGRALGVQEHAMRVFAEGDIRANVVYQLSKLAETGEGALRRALDLPPWQTVASGEAVGRLHPISHLGALEPSDEPIIALVERAEGDEEIPPFVAAVILTHTIPHLSHLGVRARQAAVPFACADEAGPIARLQAYIGEPVRLKVMADDLSIEEADLSAVPTRKHIGHAHSRPLVVEPTERITLKPLTQANVANCGAKATGAGRLSELAQASRGLFEVPRGAAVPFGVMEACLATNPYRERQYIALRTQLEDASVADLDTTLARLRLLIADIEVPEALVIEIRDHFGEGARLAVRSSANGEDLACMAGAGLYDSVLGVSVNDSAEAIRRVWASLWTRRATMSRRQAGVPHNEIRMAVLIQMMVDPELSFIIHSADVATRRRDSAQMELAVGLGETLASAAQPGTPYRMRCKYGSGVCTVSAYASYSMALQAEPNRGVRERRLDYSKIPLSRDITLAPALGARLAEIARSIEDAQGEPQDIEGAIKDGTVFIVQSRPQQGLT